MEHFLIGPIEHQFVTGLVLSLILGFIIGIERETRGKDAGISTHILVIAGAALFTLLSGVIEPNMEGRIAAQIVTGIGFLGAGLILKEGRIVHNLTTAASLWYAAAIGMAIGFGFYAIAVIAALASAVIPRIPHVHRQESDR